MEVYLKKRVMFLALVLLLPLMLNNIGGALARKYEVGGDQGWDVSTDFTSWASSTTFKVGDQLGEFFLFFIFYFLAYLCSPQLDHILQFPFFHWPSCVFSFGSHSIRRKNVLNKKYLYVLFIYKNKLKTLIMCLIYMYIYIFKSVFTYTPGLHTVVELAGEKEYNKCDINGALNSMNDGKSTVKLSKPGYRYFACGTMGHCQEGMKLKIKTLAANQVDSHDPSSLSSTAIITFNHPPHFISSVMISFIIFLTLLVF